MRLLALLFVLLLFSFLSVGAQKIESPCPSRFDRVYERESSLGRRDLFVINERFLLEERFAPQCQLLEIRVAKRQIWSVPDDDTSDDLNGLRSFEYEDVLSKVWVNYSPGKLIESDKIGFSHRLGTPLWSQYEHALLVRIYFLVDNNGVVNRMIDSFTIYFAHEATGTLKEKALFEVDGTVTRSRLLIDDNWYWSDKGTYSTATVNEEGAFKVFGAPRSRD
ncbi:MAG TPA: hypothetical protein PKD24_09695 [Pyrinomonadaceae bacterium]|nr:hypothetical protein [Pyrinomonadaceae bacterium]HMP65658.1 hypothetical protein [Pyrinomonadaceae bacterium]